MKKQVLKFGFRKAIMVAGFVSLVSFSSMAASAATDRNAKATQSTIEYVGTTTDGIVFNVKFDLIIKNEFGDVVYQQQYNDKNFDKKVMLVKEPGDARLTFMIKAADATYKQSFDISTTTRTVEDVVVKNTK